MISRAVPSARDFFRAKHSLGRGFFSMRDILPCGIFSCLCGAFPCAGLSLVRGFPLCGVPSVRGSFRAGFLPCGVPSVRGSFPCGAFSCAGLLPCGVLFRHPDWCDCRAGFRMLRASPSIIPCPGACRRARPGVPRVEPFPVGLPAGGRCRALFSACCVRALVRAGPSFPAPFSTLC